MATTAPATTPDDDLAGDPGGSTHARYQDVRDLTERLADPLSPEDQTVQSMPDVSPTKWHRAHTSWFFETFLLEPSLDGYEQHHPLYGYLFNSYYEGVGSRHPRPDRGQVSRPGAAEVGAYRAHVDRAMHDLLDRPLAPAAAALVELGLHHEQQHQELLLMDIKHVLSCNPLQPEYLPPTAADPRPDPAVGWVQHERGRAAIGHDGDGFAFDNESPRHEVLLEAYALADRPVSCGDWLAFVDDGGYQRPELWLSDGWGAVQAGSWEAPLYWSHDGDGWDVFTLRGRRPVDPGAPVCHVSYYEADAFARWAGARLPTEAEWEAGERHAASTGQVWEWTSSAYLPYPGFRPAAGAVGEYNGKFMVGQHVLRGGSWATPPGHLRPTYRNFFPPSARWPFTGLRLAADG